MGALERKQTDTLALKTNTHTQATADKQYTQIQWQDSRLHTA